jgi:glyoxylase-like metal-dependent hydrolase (beta-lactamase superfamily II)/rhodanese-related sulfurtransferase
VWGDAQLELFVTSGLGDNSYLLASSGEAVMVDPQRDAPRVVGDLSGRGLVLRYVLETHVHNDYVSGALELGRATGAEIAASARGSYAFPHRPLAEGDELRVGSFRLVAMETPGHTPEHLAYLAYREGGDQPVAVFTGGSLMVGTVGRTDLLGEDRAPELTKAQFRTLRRLAELPDDVEVLPTHGAGSFCGSGRSGDRRTSTMGEERRSNQALADPDEEAFLAKRMHGALAYPAYYTHMAPINRAGPPPVESLPEAPSLSPDAVAARMAEGVRVVDGRDRFSFALAHIPGSLNVELDPAFPSYVGWLLPFNHPLVLVLPEPEGRSLDMAMTELHRVGFERVEGFLEGGIDAWRARGRAVDSYPTASVEELCEAYRTEPTPRILDVRQQAEWNSSHIEGSQHVFVGDLPPRVGEIPRDGEVWAICASGHRSAMAASLLAGEGIPVRLVTGGGVRDWLSLCRDAG